MLTGFFVGSFPLLLWPNRDPIERTKVHGISLQQALSETGAGNLTRTVDYVAQAIEVAKSGMRKFICFITGAPA